MRDNITHLSTLQVGKPKRPGLKTARKSFSPNISTNYKMMLELYCLNKKEVSIKKELKYVRTSRRKPASFTIKSTFSITAAVMSFLEDSLLLLKKLRPGLAMEAITK